MQLHLTPTERVLFEALADGEAHSPYDLLKLLDDELADKRTLHVHVHNLRRKVRAIGEDIMCQSFGRRLGYRRIKLITPEASLSAHEPSPPPP